MRRRNAVQRLMLRKRSTRPSVRTVPTIVRRVARFLGGLIKRVGRVVGTLVGRRR